LEPNPAAVPNVIGGSINNSVTSPAVGGFIGGGDTHTVAANYGMIIGGLFNTVNGTNSLAAGYHAQALHAGSFVWADSGTNAPFASTNDNQFLVRCFGGAMFINGYDVGKPGNPPKGVFLYPSTPSGRYIDTSTGGYLSTGGVWTDGSDKNTKENFQPVDSGQILERVTQLPITRWNYKTQEPSVQHMGPVAQDFHEAFGVGEDERHIAALDSAGVALAAIQGLNQKLDKTARNEDEEIVALRKRNEALEERVADLEKLMQKLARTQASR